jgi:hypothetical protein
MSFAGHTDTPRNGYADSGRLCPGLAQTFFRQNPLGIVIDSLFRQLYFPTLPMKIFFASFFLLLPALLRGQERAPLYYRMVRTEFFKLPYLHQPMPLAAPDYELLDAALFHATNEVREKHGLPPFRYAAGAV